MTDFGAMEAELADIQEAVAQAIEVEEAQARQAQRLETVSRISPMAHRFPPAIIERMGAALESRGEITPVVATSIRSSMERAGANTPSQMADFLEATAAMLRGR